MSKASRARRRRGPARPRLPASVLREGEGPTPERAARGRMVREALVEAVTDGEGTPTGPAVVTSFRRRDLDADTRIRLGRFDPELTPAQLDAAARFEQDFEAAALNPRVTLDLTATAGTRRRGAARAGGLEARTAAQMAAASRVHAALAALRAGGSGLVAVIEEMVLNGATAAAAGAERYARGRDASVFVRTALGIGLWLLAEHYRGGSREAGRTAQGG